MDGYSAHQANVKARVQSPRIPVKAGYVWHSCLQSQHAEGRGSGPRASWLSTLDIIGELWVQQKMLP